MKLGSEQEVQQSRLSTGLRPHYRDHKELFIVFLLILDPFDDRGERLFFNVVGITINYFEGVSILKCLRQDFIEIRLSNFISRGGYVNFCLSQKKIAV